MVLLGLVKRSLCCFKRRRRSSCDSEPLTAVGVGTSFETKKPSDNSVSNKLTSLLMVKMRLLS